jgi:DNA-directed RNA polymerase specialized sigma24 family protein
MDVTVAVDARSETDLQFKQVQGFVEVLVDSLPERQRVALSLRVFEDLSFQEIAQIMECPYDTAKANYRHAVLKLKKALTDAGLADKMKSLTGSDDEDASATVENKNGP